MISLQLQIEQTNLKQKETMERFHSLEKIENPGKFASREIAYFRTLENVL